MWTPVSLPLGFLIEFPGLKSEVAQSWACDSASLALALSNGNKIHISQKHSEN